MSTELPPLTFAAPATVTDTFNVLAYGPPGAGKSTFAATAPGPLLWVNAEGGGALAYARKTAAQRGTVIHEVRLDAHVPVRNTLLAVIKHLRSGADPVVQTVVVDTLGKTRDMLVDQIVEKGTRNSLPQYGQVADILGKFVLVLRDLPVNVILIAHEDVADGEQGDRIVRPLIGGALTEKIPGEVDVVTYCGAVRDDAANTVRYVGQLVEGRGRRAKDRSGGLGVSRDLDATEWLAAYQAALRPDDSDLPFSLAPDQRDDDARDPDIEATLELGQAA
ncbi:MAG: DNA-binding protein [Solirubrobacterales bacterium]|nr:DNA-binding protein [Solirubrobacterales bacterium]